jgi:hypothetical protein
MKMNLKRRSGPFQPAHKVAMTLQGGDFVQRVITLCDG